MPTKKRIAAIAGGVVAAGFVAWRIKVCMDLVKIGGGAISKSQALGQSFANPLKSAKAIIKAEGERRARAARAARDAAASP